VVKNLKNTRKTRAKVYIAGMTNDVITQPKAGTIHLTEVPQRNVNTETTDGR